MALFVVTWLSIDRPRVPNTRLLYSVKVARAIIILDSEVTGAAKNLAKSVVKNVMSDIIGDMIEANIILD